MYHEDLKDKVVKCYNAVTGQTGAEYVTDKSGHGSMTAGILAASGNNGIQSAGIAYDASLYIVKIADENGVLNREAIADGVYWAVEQGCRIISVSVGNEVYSAVQREAIRGITLTMGSSIHWLPYSCLPRQKGPASLHMPPATRT